MALALQASIGKRSIRSQRPLVLKPLLWFRAWGYRLWWHTSAYATILGIMVLVALSLVGLRLFRLFELRQPVLKSREKVAKNSFP
jgi:hypothetical protein